MTQFWPTALCNVIYKVVTKIITNRLQCVMEYIVSLIQYSFVLGRSMVDNVINLQELLHSMSLLKGRK